MPQTKSKTSIYDGNKFDLNSDSHILSGLNDLYLTNDDVALVPALGRLDSRSKAELEGFIYSSPMDTVTGFDLTEAMLENNHYPVVCRFTEEEWFKSFVKYHDNPNVFFAVGAKYTDAAKLNALVEQMSPGVDVNVSVNIDVAHGDTEHLHSIYKLYSEQDTVGFIMSGSISTPSAAIRCVKSGCTHLRIGIGPGSACTTRLKTGCGIPQLSCVYKIHAGLVKEGLRDQVVLIADGGVRNPGDAVKYLAAGADAVMLGGRLSDCYESQGWITENNSWKFWRKPTVYKRYRGQASASFQKDMLGKTPDCAEGATGPVIYPKHSVKSVIKEFEGGLRSAISYLGVTSIKDLDPSKVKFIRTTPSAIAEGRPHGTE